MPTNAPRHLDGEFNVAQPTQTDVAYHNHAKRCSLHLHVIPLRKPVFARLRQSGLPQITTRTEPVNTRLVVNLLTGETRALKE